MTRRAHPPRRGVLLLIVLSMLTLFLMLGTAYMVAATRARATATAFARLTFGGDEARIPADLMLDTVLLRVVAGGTTAPPRTPANAPVPFESLLADKYGLPATVLSGTATTVQVGNESTGDATIDATVTLSGTLQPRPSELAGRVLSFVEPGRPMSSHRIIRARGLNDTSDTNRRASSFNLVLDRPFRKEGRAVPREPARVVINGHEFAGDPAASPPDRNEAWDGFDDANPFLARVAPGATVATSTVSRISYFPTLSGSALQAALARSTNNLPDGTDNDNDGSPDGIFLDWGLPDQTDAYGNRVQLRASVLVVDLDGRFNVNAHGSLAPLAYGSPGHPGWTTTGGIGGSLAQVPLGSGYGPAEIQANRGVGIEAKSGTAASGTSPRLFDSQTLAGESESNPQRHENPKHALLTGAGSVDSDPAGGPRQIGTRPTGSRYSPGVASPRLLPVEGRYGDRKPFGSESRWLTGSNTLAGTEFYGRPGIPDVDDESSRLSDRRAPGDALPAVNYGVPSLWWDGSGTNTFRWNTGTAGGPLPRGIYNSPPDLHGRMKTLTLAAGGSAVVPRLVFAQPEWPSATTDDPYEILLDTRRGFAGWLHDPGTSGVAAGGLDHNPFVLGELEPVLRPYDVDTTRGLPRLAAILGSAAEPGRLEITTESWDTTAIVGGDPTNGAAARLQRWLDNDLNDATLVSGTSPLRGVIAGEIARGERFDLNRALAAADVINAGYRVEGAGAEAYHRQRAAYFKDLYTLLVALDQGDSATPLSEARAKELAQWAANVVEFRDADSRIMPFEYDIDPRNGWDVDGDVTTDDSSSAHPAERRVVWGCERPEILIQETLAWENRDTANTIEGGLFIALHRPWNARAYGSGTDAFVDAEPCDLALDTLESGTGRSTNVVDLGKKAHDRAAAAANPLYDSVAGEQLPIWRLRLVTPSGTAYVRLDTGTDGSTDPDTFVSGTLSAGSSTGNAKPKLPVDTTLTLFGTANVRVGNAVQTLTITGSSHPIASSGGRPFMMPTDPNPAALLPPIVTGTCYLERLSDPMPAQELTRSGTIPGTPFTGADVWASAEGRPDKADTTTLPIRYVPVDEAVVTIHNTGTTGGTAVAPQSSTRRVAAAATAFWKPDWQTAAPFGLATPAFPSPVTGSVASWFPWPNRPFVTAAELLLVPRGDSLDILKNYERLGPANQTTRGCPVSLERLLDAVHVPTRFAGIHTTGTANYASSGAGSTAMASGIFSTGSNAITPVNQFSAFREPGRVNLNTVTSEEVWNTVVAGPLDRPVVTGTAAGLGIVTGTAAPQAIRSTHGLLTLSATGSLIVSDTNAPQAVLAHGQNPLHAIYTATRLAGTTTPRSHVFAVWITLREAVAGDPDSVRFHRAFYIVDRSIPVAFEPDRIHNVWDCVRLRRIVE